MSCIFNSLNHFINEGSYEILNYVVIKNYN